MTTTQGPGDGESVLPEFVEIAQRHTEEFSFDDDSLRVILAMLRRGTNEVLRLPEGPDRGEAIRIAGERLDEAMASAAREIRLSRTELVDVDSLTSVMETMCPLPPFCEGNRGPEGGFDSGFFDDAPAAASPEREQVLA